MIRKDTVFRVVRLRLDEGFRTNAVSCPDTFGTPKLDKAIISSDCVLEKEAKAYESHECSAPVKSSWVRNCQKKMFHTLLNYRIELSFVQRTPPIRDLGKKRHPSFRVDVEGYGARCLRTARDRKNVGNLHHYTSAAARNTATSPHKIAGHLRSVTVYTPWI